MQRRYIQGNYVEPVQEYVTMNYASPTHYIWSTNFFALYHKARFYGCPISDVLPIRKKHSIPKAFHLTTKLFDERILVSQQPTTKINSGNLVLWRKFLDKFGFMWMQL